MRTATGKCNMMQYNCNRVLSYQQHKQQQLFCFFLFFLWIFDHKRRQIGLWKLFLEYQMEADRPLLLMEPLSDRSINNYFWKTPKKKSHIAPLLVLHLISSWRTILFAYASNFFQALSYWCFENFQKATGVGPKFHIRVRGFGVIVIYWQICHIFAKIFVKISYFKNLAWHIFIF